MDLLDKIFIINLDKRTDRYEHFLNQCKIHNIPQDKVERFSAIDGKTHEFTNEELLMFKDSNFTNNKKNPLLLKKKIMGNQLSHFYILLEMKRRNYKNIIILQDDVMFKEGFMQYINLILSDLPADSEIINFGMHKKACYQHFEPYDINNDIVDDTFIESKITDFVYSYKIWNSETRLRVNPASLSYIVTKKGCDNLIDFYSKYGFSYETDWCQNLYLQSKNIFYGSKYILATGNNIFKSDVFCDSDDDI